MFSCIYDYNIYEFKVFFKGCFDNAVLDPNTERSGNKVYIN